ncbi:MAG: hypothetical protein ACRDHW_13720, partial [Ktedonobacteraceae bacterium]
MERPTEKRREMGARWARELSRRLFDQGAYQELHALPQWVCWQPEMLGGKLKKVPYNPRSGHKASTTVPQTWGTLTQALKRIELGYFYGIGFVLSEADSYCMIDLDERQDRETRSISTPLGSRLFQTLDTITEFSPRYGLHFMVRLERPVSALKSQIEVYCAERYMTITANLVPGSSLAIATRQAEVEALLEEFGQVTRQLPTGERERQRQRVDTDDWREMSPNTFPDEGRARDSDEEVLHKAMNAKNKAKFLELWEEKGRWMDNEFYQGDQSRAD